MNPLLHTVLIFLCQWHRHVSITPLHVSLGTQHCPESDPIAWTKTPGAIEASEPSCCLLDVEIELTRGIAIQLLGHK